MNSDPSSPTSNSNPSMAETVAPMLDDEGRAMIANSHHYTAENIAAIVADLKALEDPRQGRYLEDEDWRTKCGVLWRVIAGLAADVPLGAPEAVAPVAALPVLAWRQKSYWQGESSDSYRWCYSESNPGTEAEALCDHAAATQRIAELERNFTAAEALLDSYGATNEMLRKDQAKADRWIADLKDSLADDDRVLRASVPEHWKGCKSSVGAVQSYIAELEQSLTRECGPGWQDDDAACRRVADKKLAAAEARVAELEADARRLDWLQRQDLSEVSFGRAVDMPRDGEYWINSGGSSTAYGKTLRAAIDAALSQPAHPELLALADKVCGDHRPFGEHLPRDPATSVRAALQELVDLDDLHTRLRFEFPFEGQYIDEATDYSRRYPVAWAAARAALSQPLKEQES